MLCGPYFALTSTLKSALIPGETELGASNDVRAWVEDVGLG
jgi:hypothetical protein